jgi:hypothetical protein
MHFWLLVSDELLLVQITENTKTFMKLLLLGTV